jgi:flagellin-like protein
MRKGISPLIAVIMLIAFTMIVAGILAGWATTFVTEQRRELQFCSKASMYIHRASFVNGTGGKGDLTLVLYNTGDVPLSGFTIRLTYANKTIESLKKPELSISSQDIKSVVIKTDDTLDEVVVQSLQCRGAQDMVGKYDIEGLGFPSY